MNTHVAATCMPLKADAKIGKNPNARTMYLTIPAILAEDSAFPFKDGASVEIEIVPGEGKSQGHLVVRESSSKRKQA
jgi:hypothetical protein